jgi:hypothetical protein
LDVQVVRRIAEMPTKRGTLTPQERKLAAVYAGTGDGTYAATKAGYAHPTVAASKALARPAVQAAIREEQTAKLNNELLPLAVRAIERLLLDPRTPAGATVQAAKLVMDRTLGDTGAAGGKEPHEMTGEELARALDRLRQEAAERAKPVIEGVAVQVEPGAPDVAASGVFD